MGVLMALASLITTVITVFLGGLLLWVVAKYFFKLEDKSYKTALIIAAIVGAVSWVLGLIGILAVSLAMVMGVLSFLAMIVLGLFLVKKYYNLAWGKAALVWLVWFILSLILSVVLSFILLPIYIAIGLVSLGI